MINERKLSKSELEKREDIIMKMKGNKRDLVKKYGKDAEAVMYGRATNMAKKKTENMRDPKITELIKDALKNPKKADLDKDGKLSDYEKTRGAAIEKNLKENEDDSPYIDEIKRDLEELDDKEANEYLEDLSKAILKLKKLNEDSDLESGQYGDPKVGNYDITSQNDNEAGDIEALSAAGLEEDIDIGHEDNEPGMLQGDLYQIGKAAMEIYQLLDDMEGEGEVDLPSWWQAKIFKAKEAIVGAAEYLNFELKEPAIDAVVDKIEPLEIEVDPLGETVEDYITSVDDLTEKKDMDKSKVAEKILAKIKEGLPKGFFDKAMDAKDEDQDGKVDEVGGYDRKGNKVDDSDRDAFKKRPQAGMAALLKKDDIDESYDTLVNKLKKDGKSEKAAKAIAGAVASYKAKGGGKGPTAKQK